MTDSYTIKDVTQDLSFLMSLTKVIEVDDSGFWFDPESKKRLVHKLDAEDPGKNIVIFQDPLPKGDFYFFNPCAEGFGKKSPAVQLFYKSLRVAFDYNLLLALIYMSREVLAAKQAEATKEEYSLSHVVVRMSSVLVDKTKTVYDVIDEKMIDEFETLRNRMVDGVVFAPYINNQMTTKVTIAALTDPTWDEKYGTDIRKKSLAAFKAAMMGVLGIHSPSELDTFTVKYDPDLNTSARLYTTLMVYLKLYSRFNDILSEASAAGPTPSVKDEIDLGELKAVIDRLPLAYAIAKHMVQPVIPTSHPTSTAVSDTSRLRIGGPDTGTRDSRGNRRFSAPEPVTDFRGRPVQPLQIGRQSEASHTGARQFHQQVVNDVAPDPFAPVTRPLNSDLGFGVQSRPFTQPAGGYFGGSGSSSNFNQPRGLDLNPPSNFGSPGTRRGYFG